MHDIASDRGVDFLVMEYVNGKTLKELISGTALPLNEVSHYGAQVASALAAAHAAGIVHRDIKPANIMITPESQVKVLDFGVAKLMERAGADTKDETRTIGPTHTKPGMLVGTVSYMSPEQTRGEPLDGRSDIFSLGCVLYETATGRLPFQGPSTLSVTHEIATGNPPVPSALRPDLPVEFDLLIERERRQPDDCSGSSAGARDGAASFDWRRAMAAGATGPGGKRRARVSRGRDRRAIRMVVCAVVRPNDQSAGRPARLPDIEHLAAVLEFVPRVSWRVWRDKRCSVRNKNRDLAPIPNRCQVAVNLMATP